MEAWSGIQQETEDDMQSHTLIDTASPRYGFDPKIAFATTRGGAERRRQTSAAVTTGGPRRRSRRQLIRRLTTLFAGTPT